MRRLILLLIVLCSALYIGALTLTGPTWAPSTAFRNSTLNCSWTNTSDALTQNITLLKNGVYFNSTKQTSGSPWDNSLLVQSSSLTRGDIWTCRINLTNSTASIVQEVNVTILNSPPVLRGLPAGIFNTLGVDIGDVVQVSEDVTYTYDANATDADNDAITYALTVAQFCTVTDANTGTYSCAPLQAHLTNNAPTMRNVSFAAQDVMGDGVIRTVTFNITPSNDAPVASLVNQETAVNATLNYTFAVTDEENNVPFILELIAPAEISDKVTLTKLNANGTSVSFFYDGTTPDFNDIGAWNISVNITDNSTMANGTRDNRSALYNFTLNITAVGRVPYFTGNTSNITQVNGIYELLQGQSIQINITANDTDINSTITFLDDTSRFNIATIKADTNTSDAKGQIVFTPMNADVGRFNVTITIRDATTLTNSTTLQFNVTNANDAPVINEISNSSANTQGNTNATNLTGFANTLFIYDVNATDIDTPYGDVLTFSDNTSLFDINANTGRIEFTPTSGQVAAGFYNINITVTDSSGANASRVINLTIRANSPPRFTGSLQQLNCTTKSLCTFNIAGVVTDPDGGDSVALYTINFTLGSMTNFTYNTTSGRINFTVPKTDVGNYTINITIADTHGATNWSLMNISVNNTPEAPILIRYNFSDETIVETYPFTYELQATDDDYLVSSASEAVNFTTNLSIIGDILPLATTNTTARGLISFTPALAQAGNYTVQINATDRFGLATTKIISFNIYPKVPAPNISTVTPWGLGAANDIQTSYKNATDYPTNALSVTLNESTTVLFNISVNSTRPLTYNWTVDGTQVTTGTSYTKLFDYFSAGDYAVRVNVSDDRFGSSLFTWNVHVQDMNRAPTLNDSLVSPLVVNGTVAFSQYFTRYNGTKFLDPDDDLNSNNQLDGAEANTLSFEVNGTCPHAVLSINGQDLSVAGTSVGACIVQFVATDAGGLKLQSGNVTVNITDIVRGVDTTTTIVTSGGGGGSSSSIVIPITKKTEKPKPLNIIAPKLVTIYSNKSIVIPIVLNNTWTAPLKFVRLHATSNATDVNMSFDTDLFESIPKNESREVQLTITNYRLGGNYEVKVTANVSDPAFDDTALILLNSIESANDGSDVKVKVTFANDLVNEHPECQELNEVLTQAKQKIAEGNVQEGSEMVEGVINGCKYLVSMQERIQEKPTRINPVINIDDLSVKTMMLGVLAFIVLASIAFLLYYHYSHKPEDDI